MDRCYAVVFLTKLKLKRWRDVSSCSSLIGSVREGSGKGVCSLLLWYGGMEVCRLE